MSGTVNYAYSPTEIVWVLATCADGILAVRQGIVIRVRSVVLGSPASAVVFYDIRITTENGTTEFVESDVFADIASATTEYQTRLTS